MKTYKLVVLTNAVEGRHDEFNAWYSDQHVPDVLKVPGFKSAQRFKIVDSAFGQPAWRYLALYEFEADDPAETLALIQATAGTAAMVLSDALDTETLSAFPVEAITDVMVG